MQPAEQSIMDMTNSKLSVRLILHSPSDFFVLFVTWRIGVIFLTLLSKQRSFQIEYPIAVRSPGAALFDADEREVVDPV